MDEKKGRFEAMKIKDVMTKSPVFCSPETNLGTAAEIMWKRNIGFLPVVGQGDKVIGVITDRDMCMAMATRNRLPGQIAVREVASGVVYSCKPDEDVRTALNTMREKRIRRLPVIGANGRLEGVLAVDDVVLHADSQTRADFTSEDILHILQQLYTGQLRNIQRKTAAA
jgi:CBS domain-containing protein